MEPCEREDRLESGPRNLLILFMIIGLKVLEPLTVEKVMAKKIKMVRVAPGVYDLAGWKLHRVETPWGARWQATPPGERDATDSYHTLWEAKQDVLGTLAERAAK